MATENVNKDVNTASVVDLSVRSSQPSQSLVLPSSHNHEDDLSEVLDLSIKSTQRPLTTPFTSCSTSSSSSSSASPKDQQLVTSTVASPREKSVHNVSLPVAIVTTSSTTKEPTAKASPGSSNGTSKTVPSYKATHPIGSRKVTENVITYHEPIFQSVVNCLFERKQSEQQTGHKRKLCEKSGEEKGKKIETVSTDCKKPKIESPIKPSNKKKVSIEYIVDRIRTQTHRDTSSSNEAQGDVKISEKSDKKLAMDLKVSTIKAEPVAETIAESSTDREQCESSDARSWNEKGFTKLVSTSAKLVSKQSETPDSTSEGTEFLVKSDKKKPGPKCGNKDKPTAKVKKKVEKNIKDDKDRVKRPYKKREKAFNIDGEKKVINIVKKIKSELKVKEKGDDIKTKKTEVTKPTKANRKEVSKSKNEKDETKPKRGRKPNAVKQAKKKNQPVFAPRMKREASLTAAVLVNIMYEKSPPKSMSKRSKSESDISAGSKKSMGVSLSCSELKLVTNLHSPTKKDSKSTPSSPIKFSGSLSPKSALKRPFSHTEDEVFKMGKGDGGSSLPSSPKKASPKRKISFQDEVIQAFAKESEVSISKEREKEGKESSHTQKKKPKSENQKELSLLSKHKEKPSIKKKTELSMDIKKWKKIGNITAEAISERKQKANLARLKKAKEIIRVRKLIKKKQSQGSSGSSSESEFSSGSDSLNRDIDVEGETEDGKKNRAKKGALQRAARTHVSVERKNVYENVSTSPKWCECCQSTYSYPSQTQQGTKFWALRELVDRGSNDPPTQIQSSSQHIVAAHSNSSCEVRPYGSPSHVPIIDSSPFVSQLMPHGHMGCTSCGCNHSGMLHTNQCQNYPIGGVGNLLSCQHYGNSYSMPYAHSSYAHCGCASTYHHPGSHAGGQPLLHQSNISKETPILVHRPVSLQVSHDSGHTVSLPGPLQLTHTVTDSNLGLNQRTCSILQGEITNVSVERSNSLSDQEYIDVGGDEGIKHSGKSSSTSKLSSNSSGLSGNVKNVLATKQVYVKVKKCSAEVPLQKEKPNSRFEQKVKMKGSNLNKQQKDKTIDSETFSEKALDVSKKKNIEKIIANANAPKIVKTNELAKKRKNSEDNMKELNKKMKKEAKEAKAKIRVAKEEILEDRELMEEKKTPHGWNWYGDGVVKQVTNIFDGRPTERKCYTAIQHEDGDMLQVKDCILVCSGRKRRDLPYVAKIANFFEDPTSGEMMMSILWYYRPEHTDSGRKPEQLSNEVFAAKHPDETLVACIEDRGYVLTYNEFCRFAAEVQRHKCGLLPRKKVVPDSEEEYPKGRIPPVDVDPENVFLCRQVYDIKLKRVLKNPV